MEQVLVELLKTINHPSTPPSTVGWAKTQFVEVLSQSKKGIL